MVLVSIIVLSVIGMWVFFQTFKYLVRIDTDCFN